MAKTLTGRVLTGSDSRATEQIDALADAYTILSAALSELYREHKYQTPYALVQPLMRAQQHINDKISALLKDDSAAA